MTSYAFERPRSMVAQIHKAMSDAISKGVLKPGQSLKESDLQSWFNTSRAPIREAIRLLEADGMVMCTTPVCTDCTDFDLCFGEESGESRLARVRRTGGTPSEA